ncbi:DNA-directed RNA polymerase subunit alpha [Patescibacteria group bacterium]|nr:MAG: DNA-directed RNA polymerase subunit alpha [Patescibacteria group bacterium]
MSSISLPQSPKYTETGMNSGRFEIMGCHPGYGTTLGNAIRRVLLSSLEGAAVTAVKIKGASHEFSTVPGVAEDVVHIILNLKKVRFQVFGDEVVKITLKSKGVGPVTAKDIKVSSDIEVVNPDQVIATVTDKKAVLEMEIHVGRGLGYVPIEQQLRDNKEIGVIAVDAIYTPVQRVNYLVEDMRVGKRTDFNKITLDVVTDGSITPQEAFQKSIQILVDQFSALTKFALGEEAPVAEKVAEVVKDKVVAEVSDPLKLKIEELKGLSSRTLKALEENKIAKVKDIVKMSEADLTELKGMGEKSIKEVKKAIGEFGITLRQEEK